MAEIRESQSPAAHESRRVLVVDDNADAADSLGMLLDLIEREAPRGAARPS